MSRDFSVIGCHPKAPSQRQTVKLTKKSAYDKIKRKWTKTALPFYKGWLRSRSDLSQVDFGWALWKTQKTATFSQKAKNYLLDVCWTWEETSQATASNVTSQISSLRDDTCQKCCLIQ
ncbi:hypothetical protein pdam_00018829 [Pocillopora damicornis]|uniref:Uncharacterized protein n=1 Tax=Pocillopora damicornis TaxID=46731 RepID=A0A3M6TGE8_POCDA|nr:hypothetical protein pdam_00018829 [Pocillopora damicornis]